MNNLMFHIILQFSYLAASGRIEEKNWLKSDKPNKRKIQKEDDLSKRTRKDVQILNPYEKSAPFEEQLDKDEACYYDLELQNLNLEILQHEENSKTKTASNSINETKEDDLDIDGFVNQIYEKEEMYLPNKPRVFTTKVNLTDNPYDIEDNYSPKHYTNLDEFINDSQIQHLIHQDYEFSDTFKQLTDLISSEVIINDPQFTINKQNNKDNSIQLEELLPLFQQIYGEQQLSSDIDESNVIENKKSFNNNFENESNFNELWEPSFLNDLIDQVYEADRTLIESNIEDGLLNDMTTSTSNVGISWGLEDGKDLLPVFPKEYNEQILVQDKDELNETIYKDPLSKIIQEPILKQSQTLTEKLFKICDKTFNAKITYESKIEESKELANTFYSYYDMYNYMKVCDNETNEKITFLLYERDSQEMLHFSETKFQKVLLMDKTQICNLGDKIFNSTITVLATKEFFKIQKHYKDFPELIILEFLRLHNAMKNDLLIYLRILNILLDVFTKKTSTLESKDYILRFIHKINHDLLKKQNDYKYEKIRDFSINDEKCKIPHQKSFAIIFIHNIKTSYKYSTLDSILYKKVKIKPLIGQNIKMACLLMLYNHLLFDANSNPQIYQKEKIDKFLELIMNPGACINCIMEKCVDILSVREF